LAPATGIAGNSITVTVAPNTGWQLKAGSLKVNNDAAAITGAGPTYTFTMPAADAEVTAEFEQLSYTITKGTMSGGDIAFSPAAGPYHYGDPITVTVTPVTGYRLRAGGLKYNSTPITSGGPANYSFTMPAADVTITAVFEPIPAASYSITVASGIPHGSISTSPSGSAFSGQLITVTVTPETGYQLQAGSLKYNNSTAITSGGPINYSFTMPAANVTITAVFEPAVSYSITVSSGSHGSISTIPSGTALSGQPITVTVTPETNYQLQAGSLKYNGTAISGTGPNYFFTMPAADVTVTAAFEKAPVPVAGVSVTPATASLTVGGSVTLTAHINPSNADTTGVSWTSSDPTNVTVSGNGLNATVTVVTDPGQPVTITAKTNDGDYTDDCSITVASGAGLVVNFNGFGNESINLLQDTENDLSKSNRDMLTITYTGGGYAEWYLDGEPYSKYGSSGTVCYIYAHDDNIDSDMTTGKHYLSALVHNGTTWLSKEVSFRVVE
jgi:hypothetical protein